MNDKHKERLLKAEAWEIVTRKEERGGKVGYFVEVGRVGERGGYIINGTCLKNRRIFKSWRRRSMACNKTVHIMCIM